MHILLIALLIISGIILIVLEIIVIPGLISGIVGGLLMLAGIILSYQWLGILWGNVIFILSLVVLLLNIYYSLKSKTWKRLALTSEIDSKVNVLETIDINLGDTGITITRMNTMGKVMINEKVYEAKTNGEYIDVNVPVEVIKINESNIIVKPLK
jgi:membrane-bound ClpP family serine protease